MRLLGPLALLLASGCTFAVNELDFRTREPESAFERAVRSVEANCHGVALADPERLLITSRWQAWPTGEGVYLSRCFVSMVAQPDDGSDQVRVTFHLRQCPLADLDDLDKLAESCANTFDVPEPVANQLNLASKALDADVRR